ncbi:hypothetical protein Tco_0383529 [Tanacetum coccineum]
MPFSPSLEYFRTALLSFLSQPWQIQVNVVIASSITLERERPNLGLPVCERLSVLSFIKSHIFSSIGNRYPNLLD